MTDKYIDAIADQTVKLHKSVLELQKILFILVKRNAIKTEALTESQLKSIYEVLGEWSEEWQRRESK